MKLLKYNLEADESFTVYEFLSEGNKGKISKLIKFSEMSLNGIFNLAFGDKGSDNEIDDLAVTNNGDTEKVLATIIASVYAFTDKYPDSWIYATGSTKVRTRLYRMGITKYYEEARTDFDLYGMLNKQWQEFKKGIAYEAFLVKRIIL